MFVNRKTATAVLALAVTATSGCGFLGGGEDKDIVRLYSVASPPQNESLEAAFEDAHPDIDLQITRGASELPTKVDAEIAGNTDGADILLYAGNAWYLANKDKFETLDSDAARDWPEDEWAVDGKAAAVSLVPMSMIVWNTETFPDGFETWDDLLAPDVKGKIGIRDQVDGVVASYFRWQQETNGAGYLEDLAGQDPKFYPSLVPMTQAVASGEIGVDNMSTPAVVKDLVDRGAPIDYVMPEGGWGAAYHAAVLSKSTRKDAAKTFMDFLMSEAGQEAFNGDGFAGSPLDGVEGTLDVTGMSLLDSRVTTPEVIDEFAGRYRDIFDHS